MEEKSFKIGDLVIPSSFSNYRNVYPARMVVEIMAIERRGEMVKKYRLEGDENFLRAEVLELISEA